MKNRTFPFFSTALLICLAGLFVLSGCASVGRTPSASLDTPEHHVFNGFKLFEAGDLTGADQEFSMALELDPKYSRAYYGSGLVKGYRQAYEKGFEDLKKALKYAGSGEDSAFAYTGMMRLSMLENKDRWLTAVEGHFRNAISSGDKIAEPHFFMGIAYKEAGVLEKAARQFEMVLEMNQSLVAEADREYEAVQRMIRSRPGFQTVQNVALEKQMTRADTAAILLHELQVDRLFKNMGIAVTEVEKMPRDVDGHILKTDILAVIGIGLKGLMPYHDGYFYPDRPMTRARYAMVMGDIIATLTRDDGLRKRFIGSPSPFPDVDPGVPYFNDVMVCTTRGIMEPVDFMTGRFDPEGNVTGADALLMIRKLKEKLKEQVAGD